MQSQRPRSCWRKAYFLEYAVVVAPTFHRLQGVLCQCDSLGELYVWLSQLLPV